MKRIVVTTEDGDTAGWYDADRAVVIPEERRWDGSNRISMATGSQWEHETLVRTAGGRWVLNRWSQWDGSVEQWVYVDDDAAREWLVRIGGGRADAAIARYLPGTPDEVGPPGETPKRTIRVSDEVWQAASDAARAKGTTVSELIRQALSELVAPVA